VHVGVPLKGFTKSVTRTALQLNALLSKDIFVGFEIKLMIKSPEGDE